MPSKNIIISSLLLLTSFCLIFYKVFYLNLSFLPRSVEDLWQVELSIDGKKFHDVHSFKDKSVSLVTPQSTIFQDVKKTKYSLPKPLIKNYNQQKYFNFHPSSYPKGEKISVSHTFKILNDDEKAGINNFSKIQLYFPQIALSKKQKLEYLQTSAYSIEEINLTRELLATIISQDDFKNVKMNPLPILEKIFFYMLDEVVVSSSVSTLKGILSLKTGKYLPHAQLIDLLIKLTGIPTRISFGIKINPDEKKKNQEYTHHRYFYNEIYIGNRWLPFIPRARAIGTYPDNFFNLGPILPAKLHPGDITTELLDQKDLLNIKVTSVEYTFSDSENYLKELKLTKSWLSSFSLHQLPLSLQSLFYTVLLIPFGTIILSLARVFVGINTFGIFTPILLTLFFLETNLFYGMGFILFVVLSGLILRAIMEKLYLLAVPRISLILIFVIIAYTGFALWGYHFQVLNKTNSAINYFPIIIISILIERLTILLSEEGLKPTLSSLYGTVFVALICFFLFSWQDLRIIVFNYPELLLIAISCNILIGSYSGIRLTEIKRFKALYKFK